MGLPSNQGNLFYWARPLITMERERVWLYVRESEKMKNIVGWVGWWWWLVGGGVQTERRLGVGWCLRCYVWLIWAHLFFPFSLTPLLFPPSLSLSLSVFIVLSLARSCSLTLLSFLSFFLFLTSEAPVSTLSFILFLFPRRCVCVRASLCVGLCSSIYLYRWCNVL